MLDVLGQLLKPVLSLGGLSLLFGVGLGVAAKKFAVDQDPKIDLVRDALPGANCGACGYPGCDGLAAAIVAGEAPVDACPVLKNINTKELVTVRLQLCYRVAKKAVNLHV